jgi:hypothetical protein
MFERFENLPLHVLVIHAVVVVLPVGALTGIAFALVPKWRWLLRWPVLLLGVGSALLAFVAILSGNAFLTAVPQLEQLIKLHRARGILLFWYSLAFMVLTILAFLWLAGPSPLASGKGAKATKSRPLELVLSAAVVVMGVLVIWQTVRTGDAGAKAVWSGLLPAN